MRDADVRIENISAARRGTRRSLLAVKSNSHLLSTTTLAMISIETCHDE
jgi:hypothetical protein